MPIDTDIAETMVKWRHDLHSHPEIAFQETRTAAFIAAELEALGMTVHRGLGRTGVVGTLSKGEGPVIGLRADIDALPVMEQTGCVYASKIPGMMHACGHDGHITMLLGAASQIARSKAFRGTLHFIFQPAEENEGGGREMIADGLFKLFPCREVYGVHNWPMMPAGHFAINNGPMMASFDTFEIEITGRGGHAAMPETFVDPFMPVGQILLALQTIPSRRVAATSPAVVSVTQVHAGDTWNVIPQSVMMRGTARCFSAADRDVIENALRQIAQSIAAAHNTTARVDYTRRYPATVNTPREAELAARAAEAVTGGAHVARSCTPSMASEDFGFMLQEKPGAYVFMGTGDDEHKWPLHSPHFDFNDKALVPGATFWCTVASMATQAG